MDEQSIPLSKLHAEFNENTEPKDEKLLALLKLAYTQQIDCQAAIVPIERIKPFSDYQPKIAEVITNQFVADYQAQNPWPLYVYKEGDAYIMSDDYVSYYIYKGLNLPEAMCIVLGPKPDPNVQYIGEPYKLQPPSAKEIQ